MNSLEWFENLHRDLRARGAAATYVDRLIEELQEHFQASVTSNLLSGHSQEKAEADALSMLGDEREIVRTALAALRRDSFVGRHRILCMIIAPPVLMTMVQVLVALSATFWFRLTPRFALVGWLPALEIICNLLVPIAFVGGLWRLGQRRFCGAGFTSAGCGILMAWSLYTQIMSHSVASSGPVKLPPRSWTPSVYHVFLFSLYCIVTIQWLLRRNRLKDEPASST
jgi:hypothetical protein